MSLSDYFRSQAEWRRQKAEEYPEDERNAQSADALDSLADYVAPDEHGQYEAGSVLTVLEPHLFEGVSLGGEETGRVVSRYGFGYVVTTQHHAKLLEELATLCMIDAYEFSCEHGDDPTETLLDFELAAATDGVHLPSAYFERRRGSTEDELAHAVAGYLPSLGDKASAMTEQYEHVIGCISDANRELNKGHVALEEAVRCIRAGDPDGARSWLREAESLVEPLHQEIRTSQHALAAARDRG